MDSELALEAIQRIDVNPATRAVLVWMAQARTTFTQRASRPMSEPFAFDAMSALAIHTGDVRRLAYDVFALARTHTLADLVRPATASEAFPTDAVYETPHRFPAHSEAHVFLDATDFDALQRETNDKPWQAAPTRVTGLQRATNCVRQHALQHAHVVTVLPQDFVETGAAYTVAAVTPGWVALGAMARFAEVEHLVGLGLAQPHSVELASHVCLDRLLTALELDRIGVARVLAGVAHRTLPSARGLHWDGPTGIAPLVSRFLDSFEQSPSILRSLDTLRARSGQATRGLNHGLDALEYVADTVGFPFVPRLGFGDR